MATVTPAPIAPAAEMAGGLNPKCSAAGLGAFGRNGGRPALWRPLLTLALLLLPAFLLSACADIRIGGFSFGSCLDSGEEFTHVSNAVVEIRADSFPYRVLETHTKEELKVRRSSRSFGYDLRENEVYGCVVRKSDWPEAIPAKFSYVVGGAYDDASDTATATTPRGQTVLFQEIDIDHWVLKGQQELHPSKPWNILTWE